MRKLSLILIALSSVSFAGVESTIEISREDATFGTQCIGGYLFAFAVKGDWRGSISIQQIFKGSNQEDRPNNPIECKSK